MQKIGHIFGRGGGDDTPPEQRRGPYRGVPPLRESPFAEDGNDEARVELNRDLWHSQDPLLRGRDRQIEENIRMLCGQHWTAWSEIRQRFVDLSSVLPDAERRWRQFPVLNRLLLWYMLLYARMTENTPVVSFQPSTSDRKDAMLAEVMDTVFKTVWRTAGMTEVIDRLTSWLIPGGTSYLKSRIDPTRGDVRSFVGPGVLSLSGPDGNPVMGSDGNQIERELPSIPYDQNGNPLARLLNAQGEFETTGSPYAMREGEIVVDVLSPLEVRGEWGANVPWARKAWHTHRTFLTPEQFYEAFGIETEPEIVGSAAEEVGELQRLMFGSGFFGPADGRDNLVTVDATEGRLNGFIPVYETWFRPSRLPEMRETHDSPGGRLLITTSKMTVRDGHRTHRFANTSAIRRFDFVNVPGRPQGTSPQEMLNGTVRTRERIVAQILQHTNLTSNPIKLIDQDAGIKKGALTNRPGQEVYGSFRGIDKPVQYVSPPSLSKDVYEAFRMLTREFDDLGNIAGGMGEPPTSDSSGELVKELRFNADRFVGPTQRRTVTETARVVEDWIVMLPTIWDEEKLLRVSGEDNVTRSITVLPEMFEGGKVDVIPSIESMLPEGRGERQARVWKMYEAEVFGPIGSPQAINIMLDEARFPHMGRAVRPGGIDRSTAEQNTGHLLRGVSADEIPVFDWYDLDVHLAVLEQYMKSPEYPKQPWQVQAQFVLFRRDLKDAQVKAAQMEIMREALVNAQAAAAMPEQAAAAAAQGAQAAAGRAAPQPAAQPKRRPLTQGAA